MLSLKHQEYNKSTIIPVPSYLAVHGTRKVVVRAKRNISSILGIKIATPLLLKM